LLEGARNDDTHPMPIVFLLSSWATKRQPLTEWLIAELHTKYQIPTGIATSWVEADKVLPLLDGLDEVTAPHRAACIKAINTYRQEHGLLPTVVCCRQADYFALSTPLQLRAAVVVQPLTTEQIESSLTSGGEDLAVLREALHRDADLRTLVSTPLMLNVLIVAYRGASSEQITTTVSPTRMQEQIIASYVQRMLLRRTPSTHYTLQQTIHWLSCLARQMKQQNQTIFYIEQMQPDWLLSPRMLWAYNWWAVTLPNIVIGILVGLTFTAYTNRNFISGILLGGLVGGLLSVKKNMQQPTTASGKAKPIPWQRLLQWLLVGLFVGLIQWRFFGLNTGLTYGLGSILLQIFLVKSNHAQPSSQKLLPAWRIRWQRLIRSSALQNGLLVGSLFWLRLGLVYRPSAGLGYSLSVGLVAGLLSLLLIGKSTTVQLTDKLIWSWTSIGRSLRSLHHIGASLLIATLVSLSVGLSVRQIYSLRLGLSLGLIYGLNYWLLVGLFRGVSSETIADQQRVAPNQGIHSSAYKGLVLGCISALSVGLSVGLSFSLGFNLKTGLIAGLAVGLSAGLLAGLLKGGLVALRHSILRSLLWHADSMPRHYPHFLDYAAEHMLLRKVGGGYIFLHRLLLDYLADLEAKPDADTCLPQEKHSPDTMLIKSM